MITVFPYSKRIQKTWHYNLGKIAKCTSIGKRLCSCSVCYGEKCFVGFPVSNHRGREFCSKLKTQKHRKASSTHGKVPIAVGFSLNSDTTLFKFILPRCDLHLEPLPKQMLPLLTSPATRISQLQPPF